MFSKKVLLSLCLGMSVFAGWAISQEPLPPPVAKRPRIETKPIEWLSLKDLTGDERFSSVEGRFSIGLPKTGSGFSPMTPETTRGGIYGGTYTWLVHEGTIAVIYGDFLKLTANLVTEKDYADFFGGAKEGILLANKGKITSEQDTKLQGWHGHIFTFLLPDGRTQIVRGYAEKRRCYQLIAIAKNNVPGAEALLVKVLDSFSILPPAKDQ